MSDEVYRSIRLSPWEVDSLLKQLDTSARRTGADDTPRRAHARLEFRVGEVLIAIKHPGESSVSKYLVATRNLSAGGMSFMYGGFLHSGTLCSIVLPDVSGHTTKLVGVVRSCRHVTKSLHEVGVQFTQKVDPAKFVRGQARITSNDPGVLEGDLPDLTGRVLFVSEIECERSAATVRLAATGLEVETSESVEAAAGLIGSKSFDLVLLDSALGSSNARDAAAMLRQAGFGASILCIINEQDAKGLVTCEEVSAIVHETAPASQMMSIVAAVVEEISNPAPAGAVCSVFGADRTMRASIERFISSASTAMKDIEEALDATRFERVKEIASTLKRSGWENGFPAFGDAARRIAMLVDAPVQDESAIRSEAERLSGFCARLRVSEAPKVKVNRKAKDDSPDDEAKSGGDTENSDTENSGDADAGQRAA